MARRPTTRFTSAKPKAAPAEPAPRKPAPEPTGGETSARVDDHEASVSGESSTATDANPFDVTPIAKRLSVAIGPDGVDISGEVEVGSQTYSGGAHHPGDADRVQAAWEAGSEMGEVAADAADREVEAARERTEVASEHFEATREAVVGGTEAIVEGAAAVGTGVASVVGTGVSTVAEGTQRAADAGADLADRGNAFLDDSADSSGGVGGDEGTGIDVVRSPAPPGPDIPVPYVNISGALAEEFPDEYEAATDAGGTAVDNLLDAAEIAKGDFGSGGAGGGWTEADPMLNFGGGGSQTGQDGAGSSGQSGPGDGVDFGDDVNVGSFVEDAADELGDLADDASEAGENIIDDIEDAVDDFVEDAEDTKDDAEDAFEEATGFDLDL